MRQRADGKIRKREETKTLFDAAGKIVRSFKRKRGHFVGERRKG